MSALLIRDLPPALHQWLRTEAQVHHRSANRHVIALLDAARAQSTSGLQTSVEPINVEPTLIKLAELQRRIAAGRTAASFAISNEDALGYDANGLPT